LEIFSHQIKSFSIPFFTHSKLCCIFLTKFIYILSVVLTSIAGKKRILFKCKKIKQVPFLTIYIEETLLQVFFSKSLGWKLKSFKKSWFSKGSFLFEIPRKQKKLPPFPLTVLKKKKVEEPFCFNQKFKQSFVFQLEKRTFLHAK